MIDIENLIFDAWNLEHIARHNVTQTEVEQVFRGQIVIRKTYNERFLVLGKTALGRVLAVVIHPKTTTFYYVVTARSADRQERSIYLSEIQQGGEQAA